MQYKVAQYDITRYNSLVYTIVCHVILHHAKGLEVRVAWRGVKTLRDLFSLEGDRSWADLVVSRRQFIGWSDNHFNNLHFRKSLETKRCSLERKHMFET